MNFSFKISKQDTRSKARAGVIKTPHGEIKTPAFSPVATKASVKTLSPEDIKAAGSQVVLGNTYHLFLRPGLETIKMFGGFGPFMGWDGPTITDSGGYQVSFLWQKTKGLKDLNDESWGKLIKITDEGAVFSSYLDGTKQLLSPEKSIEIQKVLGADIIMAFDQPLGSAYSARKKKEAFERTLKWEERSWALEKNNLRTGFIRNCPGRFGRKIKKRISCLYSDNGLSGYCHGRGINRKRPLGYGQNSGHGKRFTA